MNIDTQSEQFKSSITCHVDQRKLTISAFADSIPYQGQKTFQQDVDINEIAQSVQNKNFKILQKDHQTIKLKVLCFNIYLHNMQKIQAQELKNCIKDISEKFNSLSKVNQQCMTSISELKNQIQILSHQLQASELKNAQLTEQIQKVQNKLVESQSEWIYFETPKRFAQFPYNTLDEVSFSFESVIGNNTKAREMKLVLFLRTGAQSNTSFQTRTRVINEGKDFQHWTMGHRYPQSAISYNSETVIFPIHKTRQIRVKANHIQPTNCHMMQYYIFAYRE